VPDVHVVGNTTAPFPIVPDAPGLIPRTHRHEPHLNEGPRRT
jgi:hypothetical protein